MRKNLSVIYILWLRQLKRFSRSKARMIGSLAQPMLFLFALWFGFGPIYAKAGGGDYLSFLAPGIIAMSVLFASTFMGLEVIWDKKFGFLKETLVAPVSRITIVAGRTFGGATVAFIQGAIVLIVTLLVGFKPDYAMIPLALVFMFMIALMFTAFGTMIATIVEDMHAFPLIMNFILMPLFFLSGALFPLDGLPKSVAVITYFNPLSYGVDGVRGALTGTSHFGIALDFFALLGCLIVMFVITAYFFSKMEA